MNAFIAQMLRENTVSETKISIFIRTVQLSRGGFRLVGALGSTKCGGPLPEFSHSVPFTSFGILEAYLSSKWENIGY